MKSINKFCICLLFVSCRGAADGSRALATANLAALEETVDMESRETDADEVLLFDGGTVDLGELPIVGARNGSDKSVTFAVQGIVTDE